jgi:protein-tyrosine phosphatase
MKDHFDVLVVCTGNIGRSPMAEALLTHHFAERAPRDTFLVRSAGTWARDGDPMELGAIAALTEYGIKRSFQSRLLTEQHLADVDLVLTATREHRSRVSGMVPAVVRRCFTLFELARIIDKAPAPPQISGSAVECARQRVTWAGQVRGASRPDQPETDDLDDPYGAPLEVYRSKAALIDHAARVIATYLTEGQNFVETADDRPNHD